MEGCYVGTDINRSSDILSEAVRKLDISVLISQMTFIKVLAEGFDFLAGDCCNGLDVIAELCESRAEDLKRLGMEDEAELVVHLMENLRCAAHEKECGAKKRLSGNRTDEIDALYRIEFVRSMMKKLIERLEKEVCWGASGHRRAA
jgi:hypothetical protein